jgi:hypothetical protein
VKWSGKPVEKKLNGLKAFIVAGTGKYNQEPNQLWIVAITAPNGKVVLCLARTEADVAASYKPVIDKIMTSFGPPV